MARVTRRVHYQGNVQGVGFRRRTVDLASIFAVTGYVRNLPDGTVEVLAAGEAGSVRDFLTRVAQRMHREIAEMHETEAQDGPFQDFAIRR